MLKESDLVTNGPCPLTIGMTLEDKKEFSSKLKEICNCRSHQNRQIMAWHKIINSIETNEPELSAVLEMPVTVGQHAGYIYVESGCNSCKTIQNVRQEGGFP